MSIFSCQFIGSALQHSTSTSVLGGAEARIVWLSAEPDQALSIHKRALYDSQSMLVAELQYLLLLVRMLMDYV